MAPAAAALEPGVLFFLAIAYWVLRRVIDRVKAAPSAPATRRETLPAAERARGAQTTQEEAEELERWLRGTVGVPAPAPPPIPAPVAKRAPMPKPRPKPRTEAGPMGRRAPVSLQSHDEVEERRSLEQVGRESSYDDLFTEREAPVIINLDNESAIAAQRRINDAARRNRAHSTADHDAFHQRRGSPEAYAVDLAAQKERRRRALRAAFISGEILGKPIGLRGPS